MKITTGYSTLGRIALGAGALSFLPSVEAAFAQCGAGWEWVRPPTFPAHRGFEAQSFRIPVIQFQGSEPVRDCRVTSSTMSGVLCVVNRSPSLATKTTAHRYCTRKQPFTNSHRSVQVATMSLPRGMTLSKRSVGATRSSTACTPLAPSARGTVLPSQSREPS